MSYKVLFRCNAGIKIGIGHLSRCLTLACALSKRNIECSFLIPNISKFVKELIKDNGFFLSEFTFKTLKHDFDRTARFFIENNFNFLVLDGYDFDKDYLEWMYEKDIPFMYIDDMINLTYKCTYVFNQNFYAKKELFNALPDTKFLLGPHYALLRDEFFKARENLSRNYPTKASKILITFGGSDPTNETMKALDALELITYPLDVKVILGCMNPLFKDIKRKAKKIRKHRVEVLYNITNISRVMVWADLVISNSGTTCMELCSLGLTGLIIVVVDNQRLIGKTLDNLNLFRCLGFHEDVTPKTIADELEHLINDKMLRMSMIKKCLSMVDGKGAGRVAEEIEAYCKINHR